ncbi:MAG: hypothetical protein ACRC50_05130 [Gaiella sp.]
MTSIDRVERRRSAKRARRPWLRWLALTAAGALLLALGVAFGLALGDRPEPGGEQTIVRTLEPLPQRAP